MAPTDNETPATSPADQPKTEIVISQEISPDPTSEPQKKIVTTTPLPGALVAVIVILSLLVAIGAIILALADKANTLTMGLLGIATSGFMFTRVNPLDAFIGLRAKIRDVREAMKSKDPQ